MFVVMGHAPQCAPASVSAIGSSRRQAVVLPILSGLDHQHLCSGTVRSCNWGGIVKEPLGMRDSWVLCNAGACSRLLRSIKSSLR